MSKFEHLHTVRFSEVDQAGVVFFARYFEIAHAALESYFQSIGFGFQKIFSEGKWGFPLVHAEADYKRPARLGEVLTVSLVVQDLSESSFTIKYDILGDGGKPVAQLSTAHVWVDLATFSKTAIPVEVADKLQRSLTNGAEQN